MITIIIGTNRPESNSGKVARIYSEELQKHHIEHKILALENRDIFRKGDEMTQIEREYLLDVQKFIFILPEYNGSFPGIFKLFIDNSDIKKSWWYKKVLLVGVADGRAGNLRGLEHMTNILHYLKMNVYYQKVYLAKVNDLLPAHSHTISDLITLAEIDNQVKGFIEY